MVSAAGRSPRKVSLLTLSFGYPTSQDNGNLSSQTITRGSQSWTQSYTYDAENRQITANIKGTGTTYNYDGDGRRITKSSAGVVTTYVVWPRYSCGTLIVLQEAAESVTAHNRTALGASFVARIWEE